MPVEWIDVVKIVCCFFLPPVAVGLEKGWCGAAFWLNVVLTLLGWLPGQIHACCVVLIKDDKEGNNAVAGSSNEQPATAEQPKTEEKKEAAKKEEKKEEVKAEQKKDEAKAEQKDNFGMTVTCYDICKIIAIFLLPPLAVAMEKGCCTCAVLLNILLTLLGWIPGVIHASCVVIHCEEKNCDHNH